jgi:thiamine pyrophosphate-dependent acetolactate synthase large subunit-like protein
MKTCSCIYQELIYFFQASLQKQIKDLDPTGAIQKFLSTGGTRPDITDVINRKLKPKNVTKKTDKNTEKSGIKTVKKIEKIKQEYDDDEVYICEYMCMYMWVYAYIYVYVHIYLYVFIYIYI